MHVLTHAVVAAIATIVAAAAAAATGHAAPPPLRIGVLASYSGIYADYGRQFDAGMTLYLKEHGGKIAGRRVELVRRDTAGPAPELAKRLARELISREKIDLLTGLDLSPNAYAIAPLVTAARIPTVIMNASSSAITASSPYMARVSFTMPQLTAPLAAWMLENGVIEAVSVVADYGAGIDAENAFGQAFVAGRGRIAGQLRVPLWASAAPASVTMDALGGPDFTAVLEQIKATQPQSVFFFLPSGPMPAAFLRQWQAAGMPQRGVRLYATGDATDDRYLQEIGSAALGAITSHHYSTAHPSAKNKKFLADCAAAFGSRFLPDFFAVAAYDGLAAIDAALTRTHGDTGGDKVMQALKGLKLDSPRGPIEIDALTRDIVQNIYIRRTERIGGRLVNTELRQYERVRETGKFLLK